MERDNVIDNKITMILWHTFENYQAMSEKDISQYNLLVENIQVA